MTVGGSGLLMGALLGAAVALLLPARAGPERRSPPQSGLRRDSRIWVGVGALLLVASVVLVPLTGRVPGPWVAVGAVVAVSVGVAGVLVSRRRDAARARVRARQVQQFCALVAGDLEAGAPPHRALRVGAETFPDYASVASAAELGADVPTALRLAAAAPGRDDLRLVAAAWQVAHRTGEGLAMTLRQVEEALRERRRTALLVDSELASARATSRMLALLPLVLIAAGSGLGADPLGFLTGSIPGVVCLSGGAALALGGLLWLDAIADRVGS